MKYHDQAKSLAIDFLLDYIKRDAFKEMRVKDLLAIVDDIAGAFELGYRQGTIKLHGDM